MNRWTIPAALTLGASIAVSCMVYGPDDLPGIGQSGGGTSGQGGTSRGGMGGGSGAPGGSAGESPLGGAPSGNGGGLTAGGGSASGGRAGESFGGEGGEAGAPMPGGTSGAGTAGTSGGGTGGGAVVDKTLIDDMEDSDNRLARVMDPPGPIRNGYWYTYANGTYAAISPVPGEMFVMAEHPEDIRGPGEPRNVYAFRLYAKQVAAGAGNGAAAAFRLLADETLVYDGARYIGLSCWVRASKNLTFRFKVATRSTDSDCEVCSDHHFVERSATTAWTKVQVLWDDPELLQDGWGTVASFEPTELVGVQLFVPAATTSPEMELWIDDVAFIAPPVDPPSQAAQ